MEKISRGSFALQLRKELASKAQPKHVQSIANKTLQRFQVGLVESTARIVKHDAAALTSRLGEALLPAHFATSRNAPGGLVDILPRGTRLFFETQRVSRLQELKVESQIELYVIEQPPGLRTVMARGKIARKKSENKTKQYRLAFPYVNLMIVLIRMEGMLPTVQSWAFYNKKPLSSIDDLVYQTNLPNVYADGSVCMGDFHTSPDRSNPQTIDDLVDAFWNYSFNSDVLVSYNACRDIDKDIKTLGAWEKSSVANPFFIMDIDFPQTGTVRQVATQIIQKYCPDFKKLASLPVLPGQKSIKALSEEVFRGRVGQDEVDTLPLIRETLTNNIIGQLDLQLRTLTSNIARSLEEQATDDEQLAKMQQALLTAVEKI